MERGGAQRRGATPRGVVAQCVTLQRRAAPQRQLVRCARRAAALQPRGGGARLCLAAAGPWPSRGNAVRKASQSAAIETARWRHAFQEPHDAVARRKGTPFPPSHRRPRAYYPRDPLNRKCVDKCAAPKIFATLR